jgi:hypothetical protein
MKAQIIKCMISSVFTMIIFVFYCNNANASLSDHGSYVTDTVSNIDWLKLTQTTNRSYNDISSQLGSGGEFNGWRYATGLEFETMLFEQGAIGMSCFEVGTNFCGYLTQNQGIGAQQLNLLGDPFAQYLYGRDIPGTLGYSMGILADEYSANQLKFPSFSGAKNFESEKFRKFLATPKAHHNISLNSSFIHYKTITYC